MFRGLKISVLLFVLIPVIVFFVGGTQSNGALLALIFLFQLYVIIIQSEVNLRQIDLTRTQLEPILTVSADPMGVTGIGSSYVVKVTNQSDKVAMDVFAYGEDGNRISFPIKENNKTLTKGGQMTLFNMSQKEYGEMTVTIRIQCTHVLGGFSEFIFLKPPAQDFSLIPGVKRSGFFLRAVEDLVFSYRSSRILKRLTIPNTEKKVHLKRSRLLAIGIVLGLIFQGASIYLHVSPPYTTQSESQVLSKYVLVPWVTSSYYYFPQGVLVEPGNNLTGQLVIQYQGDTQVPGGGSLPYFYLISNSQWEQNNAKAGFPNHVYRSMETDVSINYHDRSITIQFAIFSVNERSNHLFVVVPAPSQSGFVGNLQVDVSIHRIVSWSLPILATQVLSLASFLILAADRVLNSRSKQSKKEDNNHA